MPDTPLTLDTYRGRSLHISISFQNQTSSNRGIVFPLPIGVQGQGCVGQMRGVSFRLKGTWRGVLFCAKGIWRGVSFCAKGFLRGVSFCVKGILRGVFF